jgi:hypothetical protein
LERIIWWFVESQKICVLAFFLPVDTVLAGIVLASAGAQDAFTGSRACDGQRQIELSAAVRRGYDLTLVMTPKDESDVGPFRADIEACRFTRAGWALCVRGWLRAGIERRGPWIRHGEPIRCLGDAASAKQGVSSLTQAVQLPRVHEVLTRTIELVDGENVVYVDSSLRNLLAFDRPICWAEHATIGSPFLDRGVTGVDMSKNRAMTRPHEGERPRSHRLPSGVEFEWPMAPMIAGGKADLRAAPKPSDSLDHTTHLMTEREHAFVTALHPQKRLLLGYVFKTSESPWLQTWEHYPPQGVMARGLEFGTQAFDLSRGP